MKINFLKNFLVILLTGISFLTSGCIKRIDLIQTSYNAADQLIERSSPPLHPNQTILIASIVNIDKLEQSSTFGRTLSEYIGSRLSQHNYTIVEIKLRKSIFIKQNGGGGEFLLSRDLKDLSVQHNAQALVVGTYSLANDYVYLSTRIIRMRDSTIQSSYGCRLVKDDNINAMLRNH